jgi:hypothetical protein
MKRLILIILASSGLVGAQAQPIISDAPGGALMGTSIGGFACSNRYNQTLN